MTAGTSESVRSRRRERLLAIAIVYAAVAAIATLRWGSSDVLSDGTGVPGDFLPIVGTIGYTSVGVMILWRQPRNGIGRLGLTIGLAFSTSATLIAITAALTPAGLIRPVLPGLWNFAVSVAITASEALVGAALVVGTILFIAWFPSGRRSSRLGATVEAMVIVAFACAVLLFFEEPVLREFGWTPALGRIFETAPVVAVASLVGAWALAIVDLLRRYRRTSAVEQTQMRLVVAAVVSSALLLVAVILFAESAPALWDLWVVSTMVPMFAVAIAITRYRLYDIDRIVSRSIGYAVVTAFLFAVFFAVNVALQRALGDVVGDSPVVVAVSTLIVAALFQPLRTRVQRAVDRRFHRARYDAERTVAGFSGRLRDELDLPTLTGELRRATVDAVEPSSTTVWLRAGNVR